MKFYRGLFFALLLSLPFWLIVTVCHAEDTYNLQIKTSDTLPVNKIQWNDAYYKKCNGDETLNACIDRLKPEIDAERAVRLANADESISHPAPPIELTKAQLKEEKLSILSRAENEILLINEKLAKFDVQPIEDVKPE